MDVSSTALESATTSINTLSDSHQDTPNASDSDSTHSIIDCALTSSDTMWATQIPLHELEQALQNLLSHLQYTGLHISGNNVCNLTESPLTTESQVMMLGNSIESTSSWGTGLHVDNQLTLSMPCMPLGVHPALTVHSASMSISSWISTVVENNLSLSESDIEAIIQLCISQHCITLAIFFKDYR